MGIPGEGSPVATAPQCGILAAPQEDRTRRAVGHGMNRHRRTLWLAVGALVCLDWMVKMWLLSAFVCATCTISNVALTAAPSPTLPQKRISEAGIYYGHCSALTLAVVLFPEPCDWERTTPTQALASR